MPSVPVHELPLEHSFLWRRPSDGDLERLSATDFAAAAAFGFADGERLEPE